MEQATEKIIDIITTTVHPNNVVNLDLSETGITSIVATTSIELENIHRQLTNTVFKFDRPSEIDCIIQNYQSLLIRLLNNLFNYQYFQAGSSTLINLYSSLSLLLAQVLTYIETYFSKYFNIDEGIPQTYYSLNSKDFEQQLSKVKADFRDKNWQILN